MCKYYIIYFVEFTFLSGVEWRGIIGVNKLVFDLLV